MTASESEKKQDGPKTERTKKQTERSQTKSFFLSRKFFLLLFCFCSAHVPPMFFLCSSSFLFCCSIFSAFFLFHSFSWCSNNAEIFRLFKYEESKKCGVKFRLKRPCFLMMDMNALCSLRLFMVEHRTVFSFRFHRKFVL